MKPTLKKKKEKKAKPERTKLGTHLMKAGIRMEKERISRIIFNGAIVLNMLISMVLLIQFSVLGSGVFQVILAIVLLWTLIFAITIFLSWLFLFIFLDVLIFKRHKTMEEVLPDYLQLVAANLRAGMGPDRAMWKAVRPEFGVLSHEIEQVAKDTFAGKDLSDSLKDFSDRYDSRLLKHAVNIVVEGIHAGSQLEDILTNIAKNIQEGRTLQKEMAANVTSYTIFIGFAVMLGGPLLMALSKQILIVMKVMTAGLSVASSVNAPLTISEVAITPTDFSIFAGVTITITSFMSSLIISMILRGNTKEFFRYLVLLLPGSIGVFFGFSFLIGKLIASFL